MIRNPAVAGQFYFGSAERLNKQVEQYIIKESGCEEAVGIMVPHAGLIYSGAVAGSVYSSILFPKTFVMLGPNHTGLGSKISVMDSGEWQIPTGSVKVDRKLASRILTDSKAAVSDSQAHLLEHSLEVQLPFIKYFSSETMIVPIAIKSASFEQCSMLANEIADAVRSVDYAVCLLASSDMSHYLPDRTARQKDKIALDRLIDFDPEGLYNTVAREKITMCGILPTVVMLIASQMLGAKKARLVKYMTSGDVSGDYDSVVGYAGIILIKN